MHTHTYKAIKDSQHAHAACPRALGPAQEHRAPRLPSAGSSAAPRDVDVAEVGAVARRVDDGVVPLTVWWNSLVVPAIISPRVDDEVVPLPV